MRNAMILCICQPHWLCMCKVELSPSRTSQSINCDDTSLNQHGFSYLTLINEPDIKLEGRTALSRQAVTASSRVRGLGDVCSLALETSGYETLCLILQIAENSRALAEERGPTILTRTTSECTTSIGKTICIGKETGTTSILGSKAVE